MLVCIAALGVAAVFGEPARSGLIRGEIFELQASSVSIRSAPGDVYRFTFDSKTWIERGRERIPGTALQRGELLEVISDRGGQYARMIHVLERSDPRPLVREGHLRLYRKTGESAASGALVQYTGVIVEISGNELKLRTRLDGIKAIYAGPDTRWLFDGDLVTAEFLHTQTHVLVRAVKNPDAEIAAVEVIWGKLIQP